MIKITDPLLFYLKNSRIMLFVTQNMHRWYMIFLNLNFKKLKCFEQIKLINTQSNISFSKWEKEIKERT